MRFTFMGHSQEGALMEAHLNEGSFGVLKDYTP